jgi:hypothetical protein
MKQTPVNTIRRDTKRVFFKMGTCSRTLFYLLDREFDHPLPQEEQAVDPLAGGINRQGYQCGMLWGASLAVGAEAARRWPDFTQASGMAMHATQRISASFLARAKSLDCLDITRCDWNSKTSIAKYMLTGRFWSCFKLAETWVPEAIATATASLATIPDALSVHPDNCAAALVRKMGGTPREAVMATGLAGGIGLSGNACGALAAAIWMNTLARIRAQAYTFSMSDPVIDTILAEFFKAGDYEFTCSTVTGRRFTNLAEHGDFIRSGGCAPLISALAQAATWRPDPEKSTITIG